MTNEQGHGRRNSRHSSRRRRRMRILWAVVILALAVPAGAQERGILAIGVDSALHAFSFESEADAVNMCGRTDCEVVATFDACLGVAHSRLTQHSDRSVWTWVEAATEGEAGAGALNECNAAGGIACAVVNVFCVDSEELEDALNLDRSFRRFLQQQLRGSWLQPRRTGRPVRSANARGDSQLASCAKRAEYRIPDPFPGRRTANRDATDSVCGR